VELPAVTVTVADPEPFTWPGANAFADSEPCAPAVLFAWVPVEPLADVDVFSWPGAYARAETDACVPACVCVPAAAVLPTDADALT
jgi:hypothetical protein